MSIEIVRPGAYQIYKGVSVADLEIIANDKTASILQFSEPLNDAEIKSLESIVFSNRPDITLRAFGHYGLTCDLRFLANIPSLQNVSLDCLHDVMGIEVLTDIPILETLTIGIYNLDNFDFLNLISPTLKQLSIHKTSSKRASIKVIERFQYLTFLYLEGQQKGIGVLKTLPKLEQVVLRSISTKDLHYLEGHEKLWYVDIKQGGVKDFEALTQLPNLKYLELWQIRDLSDISFISHISSLQNLFIQSLKQVTKLPDFKKLYSLRRIYLENLKGLTDLFSLEFAPNLTEFIFISAVSQEPEDLLPLLRNKSLKKVWCGFGSEKKNKYFEKLAIQYDKQPYSYADFKYD